MQICSSCGKKPNTRSWSRHKKGSSGHGGVWNLKAQITKKVHRPNLHVFKEKKYCTKCLRRVKMDTVRAIPEVMPKEVAST